MTARRTDRALVAVGVALVLGLVLFEGMQMTRGRIAYGEHPAGLAGTWRGRDGAGGAVTLTLDASGRFTDRREPDAGDDRRGHWGTFADGASGARRVCLRAPDGLFERCAAQAASADSLVHPYRGIALRRATE